MVKINGKPVSREEFREYIKMLLEIAKETAKGDNERWLSAKKSDRKEKEGERKKCTQ